MKPFPQLPFFIESFQNFGTSLGEAYWMKIGPGPGIPAQSEDGMFFFLACRSNKQISSFWYLNYAFLSLHQRRAILDFNDLTSESSRILSFESHSLHWINNTTSRPRFARRSRILHDYFTSQGNIFWNTVINTYRQHVHTHTWLNDSQGCKRVKYVLIFVVH